MQVNDVAEDTAEDSGEASVPAELTEIGTGACLLESRVSTHYMADM